MIAITEDDFQANLDKMLAAAILSHEVLKVTTENGNVLVMNQQDFEDSTAALRCPEDAGLRSKLLEGLHTPLDACLPEEDVDW